MKLGQKVFTILASGFLLVSLLFTASSIVAIKRYQKDNLELFKDEFIQESAEQIAVSANLFFQLLDKEIATRFVDEPPTAVDMAKIVGQFDPTGNRVVAVDLKGQWLVRDIHLSEIVNLLDRPTIEYYHHRFILSQHRDFILDNYGSFLAASDFSIVPMLAHLRIYDEPGVIIGYGKALKVGKIRLAVIQKRNKAFFQSYLMTSLYIFATVVMLTLIAMILFMRRVILTPVARMSEGFSAVAQGDLDVRVKAHSKDEIGDLTNSFNSMAGQLKKLVDNLEQRVAERTQRLEKQTIDLEKAKETAEAANVAKSDFLARMSHEIRTPLNAVTGLTNIVLKSDLTAEQRDYLNKVQIASNNLLEVINDILDFSKVEAGRLDLEQHPFELGRLMEQLADMFSDLADQKDLELIFALNPNVPRHLIGDNARLNQVLTNLIQNAVKFTKTGEIVVEVEPDDRAEKLPGQTVLKFSVSDTGIGIAADVMPTLFDPFTQADSYLTRKHEGAGLGLAICQRLVELMGGRIWAESTPGQGSTFSFTVILETQKEEKPIFSLAGELYGLKALVVDDSAKVRQVLVDLLESFTFNVSAVDSGEKALELLRRAEAGDPYRLVLMDWKMPGMDGIETAAAIHNDLNLHCPLIILVSGYGQELVQESMDTATVDTVLFKPVKPSQLFDTIMELFGQKEVAMLRRAQKPTARPTPQLAGQRVLLVEDSELNRDVAVALIEEAGLIVETAENGQIAVDMVTGSPRGYYVAVFMDIQMPVMNGYEATRKIRDFEKQQDATAEKPERRTPVIALTAHALKGEKEKCLSADMDDFLAKPLDEQDLHWVLLKWISSQLE